MAQLNLDQLDPSQLRVAQAVAQRLQAAGHRGWIVGGAVRDLALGRKPKDVDMVSAAQPDEVERIFERTLGVGRAFGIMVVLLEDQEVELATYRVDGSYSDGRRPDQVVYGSSPAEDAERRDFTCNALFLDPMNGEVMDPTGGLDDLLAGRLRTVGDAARRFAEDGLRLLRMVRFEASHGLAPAEGLHAAARSAAKNLGGCSPERVLEELRRTFRHPQPERAYGVLVDCELVAQVLPHSTQHPDLRRAALAALDEIGSELAPDSHGDAIEPSALALLLLIEPDPLQASWGAQEHKALEQTLRALRPSKALLQYWLQVAGLRRELPALAADPDPARRARALRESVAQGALRLALALARGTHSDELQACVFELHQWLQDHADQLRPASLLSAKDLIQGGLQPGPGLGACLRELEDAQLRGQVADRAEAEAWLASRTEERPGAADG